MINCFQWLAGMRDQLSAGERRHWIIDEQPLGRSLPKGLDARVPPGSPFGSGLAGLGVHMNDSRWMVTFATVVALGSGYAGCHTSGVPGGTGSQSAGGTTSSGGQSSTGGSDATPLDASPDEGECEIHEDCDTDQLCYVQSGSGTCVDCLADGDCVFTGKGKVCDPATHSCTECLQDDDCGANQRCALHACRTNVSCAVSVLACKSAGADRICSSSGYCVECVADSDCQQAECQVGACTCGIGGVCAIGGKAVSELGDAG